MSRMLRIAASLAVVCLVVQLHWHEIQAQHVDCDAQQTGLIQFINDKINTAERQVNQQQHLFLRDDYGAHATHWPHYTRNRHFFAHHLVYKDPANHQRIKLVEARFSNRDIVKGTEPTQNIRRQIKLISKECGCDQAGHLVPRELSGLALMFNLVPQNQNLNAGHWQKTFKPVIEFLQANYGRQNRQVIMHIYLVYHDHNYQQRPTGMFLRLQFERRGRIVKRMHGFFANESHYESRMEVCASQGDNFLFAIRELNEDRYYSQKSCHAAQTPARLYGIPNQNTQNFCYYKID